MKNRRALGGSSINTFLCAGNLRSYGKSDILHVFVACSILTTCGCRCDRAPTPPPTAPQIGGPVSRPLPTDPVLRLLAQLGADVYDGKRDPFYAPYAVTAVISFEGKTVTSEMLAPVSRVPGRVALSFSRCVVVRGALAELDGTGSLAALVFADMSVDDEVLCELATLPSLRKLSLDRVNGVNGTGLAFLQSSTDLTELSMVGTPIDDDGVALIADHPRLEMLDLENTLVNDCGISHLTGLISLKWLSFKECIITDNGLKNLPQLPALSTLLLDGTAVTDDGLGSLRACPALTLLSLSDTSITDAGLVHLTALAKLEHLGLEGTQVTDEGMSQLARLPRLMRLYLDRTAVSDAGMARLAVSTSLGTVEASGTRVTKAARKFLPNLYLKFDGSHDSGNYPIP